MKKNKQIVINFRTENYTVAQTTHQDKDYLVVPVVMMVEGVHSGSKGPILHKIEELGKIPDSWNGIPVTISHPTIEGYNVSANIPEIIDSTSVGRVYNTHVENKKLKAEVWIDKEKIQEVSPETLTAIEEGKIIEVSVGIYTEEIEEAGEFEGEQYNSIAINYRPDHLALLPEEIGACSVNDGCGIRVNSSSNNKKKGVENVENLLKKLNEQGFSVHNLTKIIVQEDGYSVKMDTVRRALYALDTSDTYHYLEELYSSDLIFYKRTPDGEKLYKQEYSMDENDVVTFIGNPVEVVKKVDITYIENNQIINNKKEVQMSAEKCAPCIEKKVNELIAHKAGHYKEEDREWLQSLEEAKLDKIIASYSVTVVERKETIQALSEEDKKALEFGKAQLKQYRETLIKQIQDNCEKEVWPDEVLTNMDDETLKRIHKSVVKEDAQTPVSYALMGNVGRKQEVSVVEPLLPIVE